MAPRKKTVGTANAWIVSQRKVKIGYATGWFVLIIEICNVISIYYNPLVKSSSSCLALKRSLTSGIC